MKVTIDGDIKILKAAILVLYMVFMPSCATGEHYQARLISASINEAGATNHQLSVRLSAMEIKNFSEMELYVSIVVFECTNSTIRYPIAPRFMDIEVTDFYRIRESVIGLDDNSIVELRGNVIDSFLRRVEHACVNLEGGSYLGARITSNTVQLQ